MTDATVEWIVIPWWCQKDWYCDTVQYVYIAGLTDNFLIWGEGGGGHRNYLPLLRGVMEKNYWLGGGGSCNFLMTSEKHDLMFGGFLSK